MTHTKQMYVVVNDKNEPLWWTLEFKKETMQDRVWNFSSLKYTVQPVTVTLELNESTQ